MLLLKSSIKNDSVILSTGLCEGHSPPVKPVKIAALWTQPILTAPSLKYISILIKYRSCLYVHMYIKINMLTFKYRNMKFSRNDLPFRKAPENLLESANSLSVSNPYIRLQNRPQKKLYLPQIWCKWVCLWYCPCWGYRWEPPRPGRTCVSRSHHQSSQFVSPSPY